MSPQGQLSTCCARAVGVVRGSVALGGKKRAHTHAFVLSVHRIPAVEAAADAVVARRRARCQTGAPVRAHLLLIAHCVILSASRDEEVVDGRSQVRQPGGEFNCPRDGDQREDSERITAILHRDLGSWRVPEGQGD